jgi:hypothetical protein
LCNCENIPKSALKYSITIQYNSYFYFIKTILSAGENISTKWLRPNPRGARCHPKGLPTSLIPERYIVFPKLPTLTTDTATGIKISAVRACPKTRLLASLIVFGSANLGGRCC